MEEESQMLIVGPTEAKVRLDSFLATHLNLGRAKAQRLLLDGAVKIDGLIARKKGVLLSTGQRIEILNHATETSQAIAPRPDLPLVELASGPGWIALDKPAGWPVHPLRADESQTLLNAAIARYPQMQGAGEGGLRSGVVHRLDVDTSGVILFATEQKIWEHLRRAFEEHRTQKIYRAIVAGKLAGSGRLVLDLRIAQHSPARVKVVDEKIIPKPAGTRRCDLRWRAIAFSPPGTPGRDQDEGSSALSVQHSALSQSGPPPGSLPAYRESGKDEGATLLEVSLGTGFLHQIRVMLAHIGHPVLGDKIYGSSSSSIPRQMLHARSIRIKNIYAESAEPGDFVQALSLLRLDK